MAEVRLIDANALIEEICKDCNAIKDGLCEHDICASVQWVSDAPTIDAVEVVRCKDCMCWGARKVNEKGFTICPASGMEIYETDFCSYGERRKENA